jgi:hypothetical protein
VGVWRKRLKGLINSCSLAEAEIVLQELALAFKEGDSALELAREHSALHLYHATLRATAVETLSSLRGRCCSRAGCPCAASVLTGVPGTLARVACSVRNLTCAVCHAGGKDPAVLLAAVAEYAAVQDPEVRGLCTTLRERVEKIAEEKQAMGEWRLKLTQLIASGSVEQMEAGLNETAVNTELTEALQVRPLPARSPDVGICWYSMGSAHALTRGFSPPLSHGAAGAQDARGAHCCQDLCSCGGAQGHVQLHEHGRRGFGPQGAATKTAYQ